MIRAEFYSKQGKAVGFKIKGHAGYDEAGHDIVCAGVSTAVELVLNTITDFYKTMADVKVLKNEIQIMLSESDDRSEMLIMSLKNEIEFISKDFEGTIKITSTEV